MRKLICLLLTLVIILALSACGSDNSTATSGKKDESMNISDVFFNKDNYTVENEEPQVSGSTRNTTAKYTLKEKDSLNFTNKIYVESNLITFKSTKISDLILNGWTLENTNKASLSLDAKQYTNTLAKNSNGKYAMFYALNPNNTATVFSNCIINKLEINTGSYAVYYNATQAASFDYEGITASSTAADVVTKLGQPKEISVKDYFENNNYTKSTIKVYFEGNDPEGNSVNITFNFEDDGKTCKMTSVSFNF